MHRMSPVLLADAGCSADVAVGTAHVRASLEADIVRARREFLEPGSLEAVPVLAASALAFTAPQAMEQAPPEYRSSALGRLGWTEEAKAEAQRAYKDSRTNDARRSSCPHLLQPWAGHSWCLLCPSDLSGGGSRELSDTAW
ncbi:hypothetical protein GA0115256_14457 [Streptomyces sp. DconLS]|nr:hypothetical protein GA0115258_12016 [Streptomyces sp. LamerLS-31b]SCG01981.1 hypothetical protein GA0115256_14457 [Streptomyces sp. DconLS]